MNLEFFERTKKGLTYAFWIVMVLGFLGVLGVSSVFSLVSIVYIVLSNGGDVERILMIYQIPFFLIQLGILIGVAYFLFSLVGYFVRREQEREALRRKETIIKIKKQVSGGKRK